MYKEIRFGPKCSCKELKKPDHPENMDVAVTCEYCGDHHIKTVGWHSTEWRKQTPFCCQVCSNTAVSVAIWTKHIMRMLCKIKGKIRSIRRSVTTSKRSNL